MGVCCVRELAGNVPWEVKHSSKIMTMIMMMTRVMVMMVREKMGMMTRITLLSGRRSKMMMTMMMARMMMVRVAMIARTTLLSGRRRGAAGAGVDDELPRKGGKKLKTSNIYYLCKITIKLRN